MICQACKQAEATVHLTQVIGGKIKKLDLCADCAAKYGVDDPAGFSMIEILKKFSGVFESDTDKTPEKPPKESTDLKCPVCGYTSQDLVKTGRVGCPACYITFEKELTKALHGMHRGLKHIGKTPSQLVYITQPKSESVPVEAEASAAPAVKVATTPKRTRTRRKKKVPSLEDNLSLMDELLLSKKELLEQAIEVENYEYAAKIRDEIKVLEDKIAALRKVTNNKKDDAS